MTQGSAVHDELGRHVKACRTCSKVDPIRVNPEPTGLCAIGQQIYRRWRAWCLSED